MARSIVSRRRDQIKTLRRRVTYLESRLLIETGGSSFNRAELSALDAALELLQADLDLREYNLQREKEQNAVNTES